ncbi:hypothetical protein [Actinomadura sp. CNU-125]|uniref:hypothetical protein n=1 Tax=Actinomadura sp. CNU-125 TaxID=1904961 RepID=UPI001178618D|nr:hypothetical protein [Actinomadura sp. CNU-125]
MSGVLRLLRLLRVALLSGVGRPRASVGRALRRRTLRGLSVSRPVPVARLRSPELGRVRASRALAWALALAV